MTRIDFSQQPGTRPSPEIADLIQRLTPDAYDGPERRGEDRVPLVALVPAIEVDENSQPVGEEFTVVTRNISTRGISLFHPTPIDAKYLAIELPGSQDVKTQVVMRIVHCRSVGQAQEIGGEFVTKLE